MTLTFNSRTVERPIEKVFLERWSPRAFTDELISEDELLTILEAARWAPSAYNVQPWHFVYARKGTESWATFVALLNEFNQSWAQSASALIIATSQTTYTPSGTTQPVVSHTHSFDAGAAWGAIALQSVYSGWQAHAIGGLDRDKARTVLGIPGDYKVEAAIAIGKAGDKSILPENLRTREVPSTSKALNEIASEGRFHNAG